MPRRLTIEGGSDYRKVRTTVATKREVKTFANKVRRAGDGDTISALFPAVPENPASCLIARALNFQCTVVPLYTFDGTEQRWADGSDKWVMVVTDDDLRKRIAKACNLRIVQDELEADVLLLPKAIGNAAAAFDQGVAFQDMRVVHNA